MRLRVACLVVAVLLVLPACGLPADESPRVIGPERLPPGLVEPLDATTSTGVPAAAETPVSVWMVREDGLVPVRRFVPEPLDRDDVVAALLAGATADDPPGVRSAWIDAEQVGEVTVAAGTASVGELDRRGAGERSVVRGRPDGVHVDRPTGDRPGPVRPRR